MRPLGGRIHPRNCVAAPPGQAGNTAIMSDMPLPDPQSMIFGLSRRWRGTPLWVALVALVALVLAALLWMTWQHEQAQVQEATDTAAQAAAADVRQRLGDDMQALQRLLWQSADGPGWHLQA